MTDVAPLRVTDEESQAFMQHVADCLYCQRAMTTVDGKACPTGLELLRPMVKRLTDWIDAEGLKVYDRLR